MNLYEDLKFILMREQCGSSNTGMTSVQEQLLKMEDQTDSIYQKTMKAAHKSSLFSLTPDSILRVIPSSATENKLQFPLPHEQASCGSNRPSLVPFPSCLISIPAPKLDRLLLIQKSCLPKDQEDCLQTSITLLITSRSIYRVSLKH